FQVNSQSSLARSPWRQAIRIAVAARGPYREYLRAASLRRPTSFGVRYSRSLRSPFGGRRGVSVLFTVVEGFEAGRGCFPTSANSQERNCPYNGRFTASCQRG